VPAHVTGLQEMLDQAGFGPVAKKGKKSWVTTLILPFVHLNPDLFLRLQMQLIFYLEILPKMTTSSISMRVGSVLLPTVYLSIAISQQMVHILL